jgi:hypothetical protein
MPNRRFDINLSNSIPKIESHFCRELGCYGTNPDHGFNEKEVVEYMVEWHKIQAELWESKKHPTYIYDMNNWVEGGNDVT